MLSPVCSISCSQTHFRCSSSCRRLQPSADGCQFHLADHFDLQVERRVPGMFWRGKAASFSGVSGVRQNTPRWPAGSGRTSADAAWRYARARCFREHAADSLNSQTLAGLITALGATKGRLPGSMISRRFQSGEEVLYAQAPCQQYTRPSFEGKTALA